MFCSRHSNNLQSKFLVSAQTICSILATHLIYKLSASLLSLRQTGFLLPSWWPPSTGMTFHPHFRHWSRCLYILHTWILKNKYCPPQPSYSLSHLPVPTVALLSAEILLSCSLGPEFVLVFLICEQKQSKYPWKEWKSVREETKTTLLGLKGFKRRCWMCQTVAFSAQTAFLFFSFFPPSSKRNSYPKYCCCNRSEMFELLSERGLKTNTCNFFVTFTCKKKKKRLL